MPGAWNVVARRSLYVWRGPCFRMHWCRFETPVSVWSILHFGNLMSVHLVPLGVNMPNQRTTGFTRSRLVKSTSSASMMSCHLRSRYDRSWISIDRWCDLEDNKGFLRIRKKSWFQRFVIFVPGKCRSNLFETMFDIFDKGCMFDIFHVLFPATAL